MVTYWFEGEFTYRDDVVSRIEMLESLSARALGHAEPGSEDWQKLQTWARDISLEAEALRQHAKTLPWRADARYEESLRIVTERYGPGEHTLTLDQLAGLYMEARSEYWD